MDHIGRMLETTIPIDTWILEKIKFNKNGWNQIVPIGSKPVSFYCDAKQCDRIEYYRDPSCDGNFIFEITYWEEHCLMTVSLDSTTDNDDGFKLEYARPDFFQRLDSWIWNIRNMDYILADLQSMKGNLAHISDGIRFDKDKLAQRIGFLTGILEVTGKLDMAVRDITHRFTDKAHYPIVDGRQIASTEMHPIFPEDDEIPF